MAQRLSLPGVLVLGFIVFSAPVHAATAFRILSSDDRGMTLRLDVPAMKLAPAAPGLMRMIVPGFEGTDVPGRASMPFASVLIGLPPGARASARVVSQDPWTDLGRAQLETAGKPEFKGELKSGLEPVRTPVPALEDGPWPVALVEVGEPFSLRRQRMAAVAVRPFRWDAATGALTGTRSVTLRIDFVGGTAGARASAAAARVEDDRHWEPVLREAMINYEQARSWRAQPARSAQRGSTSLFGASSLLGARGAAPARIGAEDDYPEVRVKLDSTGVYALTYSDLAANGYPANIPISQVSVHRHEFVEGANPPYVSIEIPIEVEDDGNGIFDGDDRIILFAPSWAARSRASWAQRLWGDAEVVYATAVTGSGLRLPTRPGWRGVPGLTPLASYPWTQRWERNFQYYLFPQDTLTDQFHWTEIELYYYRPDTLRFETNQLDTTHAATVSASWVGRRSSGASGSHVSWAQFRKQGGPFITVADSLTWSGTGAQTATVTVPASTLGEGNVNTLAVWGKHDIGPPDLVNNGSDNVGFNWIEATYWRRYRALNDYLSCNSAGAQGEIQMQATGFTNLGIRIYDVTDSIAPVALTVDPSQVTLVGSTASVDFQDSLATGVTHRYIAFANTMAVPPEDYAPVTRRHLTDRVAADYLMVVPEALLPAVGPLVALRQSQGLNVVVAPLESVNDEFNGGRHSAYSIKRFVRYAYDNWNAKFLLLFGDGSEDPQNFMKESSPDIIPVHKISGPVAIDFGYEIIPSDPWYVCMENCDLGSVTPVLQDLFVGRLPVQTLTQAQAVVAKLVAYENLSGDQSWRQNILLCDDDAYSGETFFGGGGTTVGYCYRPGEAVFRQLNETLASVIHDDAGLQQAVLDTFHLDTKLNGVACLSSDCSCKDQTTARQICHASITPQLISKLNSGRLWWNFQGHANEFVLTHEDLYVNSGYVQGGVSTGDDKDLLMNDGKPFLFSAFSCHANAFARFADQAAGRGPPLGEDMVALPSRGAIASWASTGYEILPFSGNSHINVAWTRAMFESPPSDPYLGQSGARVVLGETIALALARYVPTVVFNPNEKGVGLTYHLLGDPGTRLSIGPPEAAVTANQLPVTDGQPIRLHTLGDTLRLNADLASNVELTSIALQRNDPGGSVLIPATDYTLTPPFPDTTSAGGRRYHLSYGTNLRPQSYSYSFMTQDRYGVSGRFDAVFQFLTQLLLDSSVLADEDPVPPTGKLSVRLFSPKPLNPATDLTITINGVAQAFTATAVPGDASGREWSLTWSHGPYPIDRYTVVLQVAGGGTYTHFFRVLVGGNELRIQNALTFPNPFDDAGTAFSFLVVSGGPVDLQIRVFTTSGHLVYEHDERGLSPGYHQLAWDGRDAEGDKLANGIYIYRMLATNGPSKSEQIGRLVKLRKPRHASTP